MLTWIAILLTGTLLKFRLIHPHRKKRTGMYIPHEAIDAAARSMSETCSEGKLPWHNYLVDARLALEAAAPVLLEMAFDNGFTACGREWMTQQQDPSHPITRVNPYRG